VESLAVDYIQQENFKTKTFTSNQTTMSKAPKGLIILVQDILEDISEQEIMGTISPQYYGIPPLFVHINPEKIRQGEAINLHWPTLMAEQDRIFETQVEPLLKKHSDYLVLYFGLAPIPLAIHLGHKIQSFRRAQVYLRHHTNKNWMWIDLDAGAPELSGVPNDTYKVPGEVAIRFGTRFEISAADTAEIISNPTREIEIYPPTKGGDIFGSHEQVALYAQAFREALDAVSSHLPLVSSVHLFAAVPVGLAFLIGTEISPTSHPLVHLYEFDKDLTPRYTEVYIINEDYDATLLQITPKEKLAYGQLREDFKQELEMFPESYELEPTKTQEEHWFKVLPAPGYLTTTAFEQDYWKHLKRLDQMELKTTFLQVKHRKESVNREHYFFEDYMLKSLTAKLRNTDEQLLACRLFSFRETAHQNTHHIDSETSNSSEPYPRVTEEANYQADVYSLLQEFLCSDNPFDDARGDFMKMIHVLTETMWAFDKRKSRSDEMEVHRVNRYLTWYFLACRIEREAGQTYERILNLLAHKPVIELRLHGVEASQGQKVVFNFKRGKSTDVGLCLFHNGRVRSFPYKIGELPISELIEGFQERRPKKIKAVLNALITEL
jgi:hypothetical protein